MRRIRAFPTALLVVWATGLLATAPAYAAPGDLDPTFSGDGKLTTDFGGADSGVDVAVQADGKIVVVGPAGGDFALARYNPDGSLDPTFSGDGKQTTDFGGAGDAAMGVAVQADGGIVAVGTGGGAFALARYNPDGSLDPSFSGDGKQTTDFGGGGGGAHSVALQADGRIVVAGGGGGGLALARYTGDGSLDTTFSGDGRQTAADLASDSDVAVGSDGKIVVLSVSTNSVLLRFDPDGAPDASFSGDGRQTTDFLAYGVAVQPDGKIVAAGGSDIYFAVARYGADGSLDPTFSDDGKQIPIFGGGLWGEYATTVAVEPHGKIVAVGHCCDGDIGGDFALARLNGDGSLDASFSGDGTQTTNFGSGDDAPYGVAIQADGKIVAAGGTVQVDGDGGDFALARYEGGGDAPATKPVNSTAPTVSGAAAEGQTLTVSPAAWSGTAPITVTDYWQRCDATGATLSCRFIGGAIGTTYTVDLSDVGYTIRVHEEASNQWGLGAADSAATAVIKAKVSGTAPVNTTTPTISGSATEGQALTVSPGAWTGTAPITRDYRWRRCDSAGANCTDIAAASATTYTLVAADAGHTIRVRETASNAYGQGSADSAATAVIKANPGSITGTVRNSTNAAKIAKASVNCGSGYSATTASNGGYAITKVASGTYACTGSASGYRPSTQNVTVSAGQPVTADFSLART